MRKSDLKQKIQKQLKSFPAEAGVGGLSRVRKAHLAKSLSSRRKISGRIRLGASGSRTRRQEPTDLPARYGQTHLTLMEVDPYRVHAFWEVTPADHQAVLKRLGRYDSPACWVLRFHDVTESGGAIPRSSFDTSVDLTPGNWYVNLPFSGRSYLADLGPLTASGHFEAVCRSNVVHIPPAEASRHYHPAWLRVENGLESIERVPGPELESPALLSTEVTITVRTGRSQSTQSSSILLFGLALTEDQPPSEPGANDTDQLSVSGGQPPHEISLGSSDSFAGGSWPQGGLTGEPAHEVEPQLETEVVVQGRTPQGQVLWINGRPVGINPDGTFELHWTVPARSE